jgi:phage-related protein
MDIILVVFVYFYETKAGGSPIEAYIDRLPDRDKARFMDVVEELEQNGLQAARLVLKPIEGKLWEVKFRSYSGSFRILYTMITKEEMIWLHVFSKKSQKTPQKELKIARSRMKEILS